MIKQLATIRYMGWRWVVFRLLHALRLRTGYFERGAPGGQWDQLRWREWCPWSEYKNPEALLNWRRGEAPPFLFSAGDFPGWRDRLREYDKEAEEGDLPTVQAKRIVEGCFPHYSRHWLERGISPDWRLNPFTGERADTDAHWSRIADQGLGDIKHIWELSRFSWVFPLVRAFARYGNEAWAEHYWRLLEDWLDHNPPQRGVNWMCGQETAIRLMAWCFGLYTFLHTSATTPARLKRLVMAVAQSAWRIEVNLDYALQQKNNHGITECVGLITAGILFPELEGAERWRRVGRKHLRAQVAELFYADGGFSQHSLNYQRLALQALTFARQLLVKNGIETEGWLPSTIRRGTAFIFHQSQTETGEVPNAGGNDGAHLFPLDNCDYADFRPVLQAGMATGKEEAPLKPGPWDEALLWYGIDPTDLDASERSPAGTFAAPEAGVYTLRRDAWTLIAKAPRFRHRPAHADLLHVDLWYRGRAIAVDAGTYSYRADPPFEESFRTTRYHNTVEVDGVGQMESVSRFMLHPWASARLVGRGRRDAEGVDWMLLETDAYKRLKDPVRHRRAVVMSESFVAVLDLLGAARPHRYRLHWLLGNEGAFEADNTTGRIVGELGSGSQRVRVEVAAPEQTATASVVQGDPDSARGWRSCYYMEKEAVPSLAVEGAGASFLYLTLFSEREIEWSWNKESRKVGIGPMEFGLGRKGLEIG